MAVVRVVLLALVTVVFVTTVSLIVLEDTGVLEKAVLAVVAVLLALLVPRVRRLGSPAARH